MPTVDQRTIMKKHDVSNAKATVPVPGRAPRHERGRRRVDTILGAAATIIVDAGLEGLTMEAIARPSKTRHPSPVIA